MWLQTGAYHLGALYWTIAVVIIFIIAVVALAYAVSAYSRAAAASRAGSVRSQTAGVAGTPAPADDPRLGESFKILDERYARGEISRDEFMQRRSDLVATL